MLNYRPEGRRRARRPYDNKFYPKTKCVNSEHG